MMDKYNLILDLADLYEMASANEAEMITYLDQECVPCFSRLNEADMASLHSKLSDLVSRVKTVVRQSGSDQLNGLKQMLRTALDNYARRSNDRHIANQIGTEAMKRGTQAMFAVTAVVMMANALMNQHPAQAAGLVHSALQKMNDQGIQNHKLPSKMFDMGVFGVPGVGNKDATRNPQNDTGEKAAPNAQPEQDIESLQKQIKKEKSKGGPIHPEMDETRAGFGLTPCPSCGDLYCRVPLTENCSGGAVGGGRIASTVGPLGGKNKKKKIRRRDRIFVEGCADNVLPHIDAAIRQAELDMSLGATFDTRCLTALKKTRAVLAKGGRGPVQEAMRLTIQQAKQLCARYGYVLRKTEYDEFRVSPIGVVGDREEAQAYYTSDLEDAVNTAQQMAKSSGANPVQENAKDAAYAQFWAHDPAQGEKIKQFGARERAHLKGMKSGKREIDRLKKNPRLDTIVGEGIKNLDLRYLPGDVVAWLIDQPEAQRDAAKEIGIAAKEMKNPIRCGSLLRADQNVLILRDQNSRGRFHVYPDGGVTFNGERVTGHEGFERLLGDIPQGKLSSEVSGLTDMTAQGQPQGIAVAVTTQSVGEDLTWADLTGEARQEMVVEERYQEVVIREMDALGQPQVHSFYDTGDAYDASQTDDNIHDGDVLVVAKEGVVGVLVEAWPVAVTPQHGHFHRHTLQFNWTHVGVTGQPGKFKDYSLSLKLAQAEIAKLPQRPERDIEDGGIHRMT